MKPRLSDRLRYRFDQVMSAGAPAQIAGLAVISLVMILMVGAIVELAGLDPSGDGAGIFYRELLRTLDPGTVASDRGSWPFLFFMVLITFGGIFVVGALIGILSNAIDQRLQEMRKGRSRVIERDHIVVLGWSGEVFTILRELVIANAHRRHASVVVLAPHDKVEMEDQIRAKVGDTGSTRIVCRTGDPLDFDDLAIVNLQQCRAIIVLTPEHEDDPDSLVLKTLLAITNSPDHRPTPHHIVVELRDQSRLDVGALAGRDQVEFLVSTTVSAKIIAHTCRQPGLSAILTNLLDYAGDELYFCTVPDVVGLPFGEALHAFEDSVLVGVRRAGRLLLDPPMDLVIGPDDRLLALARHDEAVVANGHPLVDESAIAEGPTALSRPERTLILGRNHRLPLVVRELEHAVAPGSELTIAHAEAASEAEALAELGAVLRQRLSFRRTDPTDRAALDALGIPGYDHVVILADEHLPPEKADAHTLMTLLHVRDIGARAGRPLKIVSEMYGERNKVLAETRSDDDFIVSSQLMSFYITQVVMTPELQEVFEVLFSADEAEIVLRPAEDYVVPGRPVTFSTVVEAARRRGQAAMGYRLARPPEGQPTGTRVRLNPPKSSTTTFAPGDQVVVVARRPRHTSDRPPVAAAAAAPAGPGPAR